MHYIQLCNIWKHSSEQGHVGWASSYAIYSYSTIGRLCFMRKITKCLLWAMDQLMEINRTPGYYKDVMYYICYLQNLLCSWWRISLLHVISKNTGVLGVKIILFYFTPGGNIRYHKLNLSLQHRWTDVWTQWFTVKTETLSLSAIVHHVFMLGQLGK
jgi:hypothetical protein